MTDVIELARRADLIFNEECGTERTVAVHRRRVESFALLLHATTINRVLNVVRKVSKANEEHDMVVFVLDHLEREIEALKTQDDNRLQTQ